ncbi:MAG: leucine-rich repeat domain-containing protein, partial [Clostridia bacterium]|nr:leucine-rich repeat domain-containing protein [Clostridia bacterium]
ESWLNVVIGIDDNPNLYAKSLHILNFNGDEITELTIPDSVTSIRWYAFGKCKSLTSITIPDSVTSIGDSALSGCSSLTSITFEGTVAQWNAIEFGGSWNSNVPATEVICSDGVVKLS